MPKVFARFPGAEIRIGSYGTATADVPVDVPDAVARELAENPDVKIESPAPARGRKAAQEEKEG